MGGLNKESERGPQTGVLQLRSKVGEFEWRGMWPDGDPSSIPDNRPRLVQNGRLVSGMIVPRGGQVKLNTAALHNAAATIISVQDFQMATPYQLFMGTYGGCPGTGASSGTALAVYDKDLNPQAQPVVYYPTATYEVILCAFDGTLHIAVDNTLRRYQQVKAPWGTSILAVAGNTVDKTILTLPAGFAKISCLEAFDGKLFLGCVYGAGTSKIAVWDGVTLTDDLASVNEPVGFVRYRDSLYAYFSGTNSLRCRPIGVAGTTWTTVSPSAGTIGMRGADSGCSYKDVMYFASGGPNIWKYDGTTLSAIAYGTWGGPSTALTYQCFVYNNLLYVSYLDNFLTATYFKIAKFNGSSWTAVEKDLKAQFTTIIKGGSMAEFEGNLVISIGTLIAISPGTTTSGTWASIPWGVTNPSGTLYGLKVY